MRALLPLLRCLVAGTLLLIATQASAAGTCTVSGSNAMPYIGTTSQMFANCTGTPLSYEWEGCYDAIGPVCYIRSAVVGYGNYTVIAHYADGDSPPASGGVLWTNTGGQSAPPADCHIGVYPSVDLPAPALVSLSAYCTSGSTLGATYSWSAPGYDFTGMHSGTILNVPVHVTTTFDVIIDNGLGPATASQTVTVANPAGSVPSCTIAASNPSPLVDDAVTLTASCTGSPSSYAWSNCTSTSSQCSVSEGSPGGVTFSVQATNAAGTSPAASVTITWQTAAPLGAPVCTLSPTNWLPRVGDTLVLTADCSDHPTALIWTNCTSTTPTSCTATSSLAGSVTYAVAGVNGVGTGAAASTTVDWQDADSNPTPPVSTPPVGCGAPSASTQTLACTSGMTGTITLEPAMVCVGTVWVVTGYRLVGNTCKAPPSVGPGQYTAWEFYNPVLDHYFITANPNEREALNRGAAWHETGRTYRVWALDEGGTSPMCRFYGDQATNPLTGARRGPDSHFYTASPVECAQVPVQFPEWLLEGKVFGAALPDATGKCPTGSQPVWRYFKPVGVPNHRYVTTSYDQQQMGLQGWQPEGVVWCAGN